MEKSSQKEMFLGNGSYCPVLQHLYSCDEYWRCLVICESVIPNKPAGNFFVV